MNAYSRTLTLPGAARPVRERGASALDRSVAAWAAPDPATRLDDLWAPPVGLVVSRSGSAQWPAPDPVMRFDLRAPDLSGVFASVGLEPNSRPTDLIEPRHAVKPADLRSAARSALTSPILDGTSPPAPPAWPPPNCATLAVVTHSEPMPEVLDRSGITPRLVFVLAATAGVLAAGASMLVSLF